MSRMRVLAAPVSIAALLVGGAVRANDSAEKGARYQVRVRNHSGERLGLVIAVDGRNIINGKTSDLERREPMYVLDAWGSQDYAGWRANLEAINEFYFSDWSDSYAEAFGDRRTDHAVRVEFLARDAAESRHFIKYEWRDTLCRKRVIDCDRGNRFWDESTLGFAPPRRGADDNTGR